MTKPPNKTELNVGEMPAEIYAAMGKDGNTYWVSDRHEAMDGFDAMKQTRFIRADLVEKMKGCE